MRSALLFLFLLLFTLTVLGQGQPLSQAEYVGMLYSLAGKPAGKADVIDALRRRGIGFVLTDGIRGLTRSKGGNDDELKRALEEAERRRRDPVGMKMPSATEV